jgi:hypothetical protein
MCHREANDVTHAGGEERVDPGARDIRGVQRKPADACVGIGGHEDIAPRTARADGLRQVTTERNRERNAMDRGKVVPERRNGIKHGFHVLTLTSAMHDLWGVKTKFALREVPICRRNGSFETLQGAQTRSSRAHERFPPRREPEERDLPPVRSRQFSRPSRYAPPPAPLLNHASRASTKRCASRIARSASSREATASP